MPDSEVFYAHTPNDKGEWQMLTAHLLGVAALTKQLADKFGAGSLGYIIGLLHDIGKFNPDFKAYLEKCAADPKYRTARKIPHAIYGCYACGEAESILQPIIAGHHAGIYDSYDMENLLIEYRARSLPILKNAGVFLETRPKPAAVPVSFQTALEKEVLLRFLFSCLVDADSRNTAIHAGNEAADPPHRPAIADCAAHFDLLYTKNMEGKTGGLNQARRSIYDQCRKAALKEPGVYRLTAPTGSGKTLAALAFALEHAKHWKLDRVIAAIPYTSIIEQNAAAYRCYLPEGALLEHHSAFEFDPQEEDADDKAARWREAAARWDYPIIATTTVQLFESLFSNKRSRARKLHNVAKSVIIIDEAQTLPPALLDATVDMLKILSARFGVTVLLSTATQPALGPESSLGAKFETLPEILDAPADYFKKLNRVKYVFDTEETTWDELAKDIRDQKQILVVLNTKKDAVTLWKKLADKNPFHLSTLLCAAHRKALLDEIAAKLKAKEPCCVISTQVVEAGVDLDFPVVYRAYGPLDRIVQAAGRCNRENNPDQKGLVRIFLPKEGGTPPGEYLTAIRATRFVLRPGADIDDPALYTKYFNMIYDSGKQDKYGIQNRREHWDYPEVAKRYRFFEETQAVIIQNYPASTSAIPALLETIQERGYPLRSEWQQLQRYSVSLRNSDFEKCVRAGHITKSHSPGKDYPPGINLWKGTYHSHLGIGEHDVADPVESAPEGEKK